jgi:peptidoglycan/LPS O-acetylase OafA/YrhL
MSKGVRHAQLDGVRGYAAIAVIVFHCILDRDPTQNVRIVRPTIQEVHGLYDLASKMVFMMLSGETAVIIFFVLSGAVLFESLRRRHAGHIATAIGFTIRRFFRLYPAFFLALAGCLAAFAFCGAYSFGARHFWPNAAFYDFSVLGASWTLQVEFLAVPFILVAYWSYQKIGIVGIVVSYSVFAAVLCEPWVGAHFATYQRFLSCFALGALIPTGLGAMVARRIPIAAWPIVLFAMLSVRHVLGLHWWSMDAAQVFAALLVTLLYYERSGDLGRFLERRVSQYLGRLSFSLYLFNCIYIIISEQLTQGSKMLGSHPLEWGILVAIPVVAAAIVTAHIVEVSLERPSIKLGRWLTRFSVGRESLPEPITAP